MGKNYKFEVFSRGYGIDDAMEYEIINIVRTSLEVKNDDQEKAVTYCSNILNSKYGKFFYVIFSEYGKITLAY